MKPLYIGAQKVTSPYQDVRGDSAELGGSEVGLRGALPFPTTSIQVGG